MPRSEAQKRADKKYVAKTYKRIAVNTRKDYIPQIEEYMNKYGIQSYSGLFNSAVKYIISNDIKLDISNTEAE